MSMTKFALLVALGTAFLGCADRVTRTTTYRSETASMGAPAVVVPGSTVVDDGTTTTTTKRVERRIDSD